MKKLMIGLLAFGAISGAFAQTNTVKKTTTTVTTGATYEKMMGEKIAKLNATQDTSELLALGNDFQRIADKEKTQWQPYYYAALAQLQRGRSMMQDRSKLGDLDAIADAADQNIAKAEALSPANAELFILKKMSHSLRMMVSPMTRFMSEGSAAREALEEARKLDPDNPRISLLEADDSYYTPAAFGGSKETGLELFQKAKMQYASYKAKSALDPSWGAGEADYFLAKKP